MAMISVERFNMATKKIEPALINSDAIVWVREYQIPGVPINKRPWACDVWLTNGNCMSIHSSLEELEEACYLASQLDSKPESLQAPAWAESRNIKLLT